MSNKSYGLPSPDKDVRVIKIIETNLLMRGRGTREDPSRRVKQYWTFDGELLAEHDINDTLGCNQKGHRVRHGATGCEHCGATLEQMLRVVGQEVP